MSRLRLLILWCVIAAIPAQGVASASMLVCGPRHLEMAAAADARAEDAGASASPGCHRGAQVPGVAVEEEGSADAGALVKSGKLKCSACALCAALSAAAPAPAAAAPGVAPTGAVRIAFVPRSHAGIVPAGLERPPRTLLG